MCAHVRTNVALMCMHILPNALDYRYLLWTLNNLCRRVQAWNGLAGRE